MALQHLRSGTANKRPIPTAMSDGQLAVNTNLASPGLFFKDSNGDLVKAGPVHVGTTAPNASPASTAATALVANTVYQILTVGTSDFTAVGASANTVGTVFTATGTTTGTGTVSGQQGNEKGEQWLDTTNSLYVMKVYDGTGWRVTDSISLANGSAAAPSLHFGSDTNTGLFRSAADSLAITTAGTQRVTVGSSGNVGVGSSNPGDYYPQSNDLVVGTTSGNRGISVVSATTGTGSLVFADGTGNFENRKGQIVYDHSTNSLELFTDQTERLRIDSSGRLLLNGTTATGDNKLQIISSDASINSLTIGRGKNSVASNTALGDHALFTNTTGSSNTAVGLNTLYYVTTGSNNTAVGNKALQGTTGSNNTAVGSHALFTNNAGSDNTAVGYLSLYYNQTGNNNTAVGRYALVGNTTGSKNIGIGYTAGDAITTGSNNTIIGDIPGTSTLSDTVIIGAGTTERLRIDSTGRVGIGQSSPTTKLEVAGDVKVVNTGIAYLQPNTVTAFQAYESSGPVKISLANNGSATFASNVGIGTTSANRKLVAEQANSTAYSSSDFDQDYHLLKLSNSTDSKSAGLQFGIGSNGEAAITATEVSDGATDLCFGTRGSGSRAERMRIDSSGRLLLGTTNAVAFGSRQVLAVTNGTTGGVISLYNSTTATANTRISSNPTGSEINDIGIHAASTNGSIIAYTNNDTEAMRIDSSGNVGIGDSSPSYKLTLKRTDASGAYFYGAASSDNGARGLQFTSSDNGIYLGAIHTIDATSSGGQIAFATGNTERMRIDSSGRVGINTSSPQRMLHIAGGAQTGLKISGNNTGSTSSDGFDIYVRDDNNGVELNQREASHIALLTSGSERMRIDSAGKLFTNRTVSSTSGGHPALQINTISTGTASNAFATGIDFQTEGTSRNRLSVTTDNNWIFYKDSGSSEALRIDSSGNVGIGLSDPSNARLMVSSGITTTFGNSPIAIFGSGFAAGYYSTIGFGATNATWTVPPAGIGYVATSQTDAGKGDLVFGTRDNVANSSPTERMRIHSSGYVNWGNHQSSDQHRINGINNAQGSAVLTVSGYEGSGGSTQDTAIFYSVNSSGGANSSAAAIKIFRNDTTLRSINAAGTVNTSGNDYAEYMIKAGSFTLAKGDVCGVNSEGKLTNIFAEAISFVVKSTAPSFVGGDNWSIGVGEEPGGYDDKRTKDEIAAAKVVYQESLEAARQLVDRIAFSGQAPVNVTGASPGQYIIPAAAADGSIEGTAKAEADLTMAEYISSVGKVIAIENDGRARIIVKVA